MCVWNFEKHKAISGNLHGPSAIKAFVNRLKLFDVMAYRIGTKLMWLGLYKKNGIRKNWQLVPFDSNIFILSL